LVDRMGGKDMTEGIGIDKPFRKDLLIKIN
jgi:hypothetical protein